MEQKNIKLKELFKESNNGLTRASIDRKITEMLYAYPKMTYAQIIVSIFRSGGEFMGDPYYWSDEKTLKKVQLIEAQLAEQYDKETNSFKDELIDGEFLEQIMASNGRRNKRS